MRPQGPPPAGAPFAKAPSQGQRQCPILQALLPLRAITAGSFVVAVGACSSGHAEHPVAPALAGTGPTNVALTPGSPKPSKDDSARETPRAPEAPDELPAWATEYAAPRPAPPADPALLPLVRACGEGDQDLHEVAQAVARRRSDHGQAPELDWTLAALARRGAPYVVPRVWSAQVPAHQDPLALARRIEHWARERAIRGESRCGVGELELEDGTRVVSVIQVDARADLAPLPLAPPLGQELTLEARLLVPATDVEVVVLPPEGLPRPVRPQLDGDRVRAKLRLDQAGPWVVQLLANDEGGPLPVLGATLWVAGLPTTTSEGQSVPGESAASPDYGPEDALFAMSNAARAASGLAPLARTPALDSLAREHALEMQKQGEIAHDAGFGNPSRRVETAGIAARAVGENVARGASIERVHRALWASPSHRSNLLFPHFDEIGIGVVAAPGGGYYATLLFIESRH